MKKVIGVHAGHALIGAVGAVGYISESVYARKIKKEVLKEMKRHNINCVDNSIKVEKNAENVLKKIRKKHLKHMCTSELSIHINSGGGTGVELLVPKKITEKDEKFVENVCRETFFENRGVKVRENLYVLNCLNDCVLLEVGFVDNKRNSEILKKNYKKIGKVIAVNYLKYKGVLA